MVSLPKVPATRRRWAVGSNVLLQILLASWLLLLVNGWAFKNSWRVDLTREHKHVLDPATLEFLRTLPRGVEVVIPFSNRRSPEALVAQRILDRAIRVCEEFELANPSFHLAEAVNVLRDPVGWTNVREKYKIEAADCVYLFCGERREVLLPSDMARFFVPETPDPDVVTRIESEHVAEALASAVKRVISTDRPRVWFAQGSGEMPVDAPRGQWAINAFRQSLVDRGYEVAAVDLRTEPEVDADLDLLILVCGGPDGFTPYSGDRREAIERFVDRGGSLLVFMPILGGVGLEDLFRRRGLDPGDSFVTVDGPSPGRVRGPTTFMITGLVNETHPATRGLRVGEFDAEVTGYRAVHVDPQSGAQSLLTSPAGAWLERDPRSLRRDESDPVGQFSLIAVGEEGSGGGRLVVVGGWNTVLDASTATGTGRFEGGARRLIMSIAHWLVRDELAEVGPGRTLEADRIVLTEGLLRAFRWCAWFVMPACVLIGGLTAFWLRRRSGR